MEQIENELVRSEEEGEDGNMFLYDGCREKEACRRSPQFRQRLQRNFNSDGRIVIKTLAV